MGCEIRQFNGDMHGIKPTKMGIMGIDPLVMTNILLLNMAHLASLTYLLKVVIFHSYVTVYQRVPVRIQNILGKSMQKTRNWPLVI